MNSQKTKPVKKGQSQWKKSKNCQNISGLCQSPQKSKNYRVAEWKMKSFNKIQNTFQTLYKNILIKFSVAIHFCFSSNCFKLLFLNSNLCIKILYF